MATFPTSIISFGADVVDGVDDVMAAHVNSPRAEIVALETYLLGPRFDDNLLACSLTYDESWQGGTSTTPSDDQYSGAVLWNTLTNSASAPTIAGVAGGTADPFVRQLRATLNNSGQLGIVQFVGSQRTKAHRGQVVSLSADIWGTGISNVRMAVVVWTGTADSVTSDIVSSWGASPTLAANWDYIGTPADIAISASRARKSVLNLTIPSNANNLGVFIWTPASEANTDLFNVARVKLEPGATATEFVARDTVDETLLIGQYWWKSFPILTAPATNAGTTGVIRFLAHTAGANTNRSPTYLIPGRMRTAPTATLYNPSAANSQVRDLTAGADCSGSTVTGAEHSFTVNTTANASTAVGNALAFHVTLDARL